MYLDFWAAAHLDPAAHQDVGAGKPAGTPSMDLGNGFRRTVPHDAETGAITAYPA